jgi:murein DD-endopeptidase MepM/ murein hydrolase activator NlpD
MQNRPIAIALAASALYSGVLVATAHAETHYVRVTLVTGQQLTVTVDVPPGTPVSQVSIPGLPAPVSSIVDLGVAEGTPTPTQTASPTATASPTQTATPTQTSTPQPNTGSSDAAEGKSKKGAKKHKPKTKSGDTGDSNTSSGGGEANKESLSGKVEEAKPKPKPTPPPAADDPQPPARDNPSLTVATPGAAKVGVPNFFIDKFRVPPFLLPIYQAAGTQYGIKWELLAAINEIETDYGRNTNVSSAGALGWMQFMPASWDQYGVDANKDGVKDPYNPVDAIFAAARYLKAAGADKDIRGAVFAYNHADWYVDQVLMRAQILSGLPTNLVGSLTGLTEGRFPVMAKATYAEELDKKSLEKSKRRNPVVAVSSTADRRGISIFAGAGAPVIAVTDAKVVGIGRSARLGRYVKIQDAYGNTYTYGRLAKVSQLYAAPKPERVTAAQIQRELKLPKPDAAPKTAASDTSEPASKRRVKANPDTQRETVAPKTPAPAEPGKLRLFAHPTRANSAAAGGAQQEFLRTGRIDGALTPARAIGLARDQVVIKHLKVGAQIPAGTVLGRIGKASNPKHPYVRFEIRPAGRGAPRIDPKPILDGWKLLESTAIYRAKGKNPFVGDDAATPSVGQILLMDKDTLAKRVLADPRIQIYGCGRTDIQGGAIDRRVLATLEFLVASGFNPTVSALECGHSYLTDSGNVSEHSSGNAVDIAAINGIPILGHQGAGSITELVIQRLLTLQGTMKPHQIISLMTFDGADNTLSLPDHADHIHVGFKPLYGANTKLGRQLSAILKPSQWTRLIERLGKIDNPKVSLQPSKYALKTDPSRKGPK